MLDRIKKQWKRLKRSEPGKRFQEQHERSAKEGTNPLKKPLLMAAGILLAVVGVFLMLVPGPGLPILLVGAVLVAGQSLSVAKFLDWLELKLRPMILWLLGLWYRMATAAKPRKPIRRMH